jgi:hypothetical protein
MFWIITDIICSKVESAGAQKVAAILFSLKDVTIPLALVIVID